MSSKKEIMDEIKGHISDLEHQFKTLENQFESHSKQNLNPAIKLGINWLVAAQNEDGGWGIQKGKPSVTHLCAFALLALSKAAQSLEEKTIQKALIYLRNHQSPQGWWPLKIGSRSESVGVTGLIVQALHILGLSKGDELLANALDFLKESLSASVGAWRDNDIADYWEISVNESALSAICPFLTKSDREKLAIFKNEFLKFDPDEGYGWKLDHDYQIDGDIENTAIALKILANLGVTKENDVDRTVEKAVNFIFNARVRNAFPPKKHLRKHIEDVENDSTALVISGLIAVGYEPYNEVIRQAAQFLSDSQNPDGGWGDAPGMESDTDSTSLAVIALIDAGKGAVPLAEAKQLISNTKSFIHSFIEKHVEQLDIDLKHAQRLNRLLEINITLLAIIIPIIVAVLIG